MVAARAISKTSVIKMKLLEMFSGTHSVGKAFKERGYDVISVDISDKFEPTVVADVLQWDYTVYPPGHFDVIWNSPVCTEYSCAKTVGIRDLVAADALVTKILEL